MQQDVLYRPSPTPCNHHDTARSRCQYTQRPCHTPQPRAWLARGHTETTTSARPAAATEHLETVVWPFSAPPERRDKPIVQGQIHLCHFRWRTVLIEARTTTALTRAIQDRVSRYRILASGSWFLAGTWEASLGTRWLWLSWTLPRYTLEVVCTGRFWTSLKLLTRCG